MHILGKITDWLDHFNQNKKKPEKQPIKQTELFNYLSIHRIFRGFQPEELRTIESFVEIRTLEPGTMVLRENTLDAREIYIVLDGIVDVLKKGKKIKFLHFGTIGKNEFFGELALIDNMPRSVSIMTKTKTKLLILKLDEILKNNHYKSIKQKLTDNIFEFSSNRLVHINHKLLEQMEIKAELQQKQKIFGSFTILIFSLISLYTIFLEFIRNKLIMLGEDIQTLMVISLFFIFIGPFIYIKKLKPEEYGISLHQFSKKLVQAILYTIPILIMILTFKIYLVLKNGLPLWENLFTPKAQSIKDGVSFSLILYLMQLLTYSIFSFFQEILARGVIQNSIRNFLSDESKWLSILSANIIFAATHAHKSFYFSVLSFILGLFWGWLYDKQSTALTVAVSHILVGTWALCIVGIQHLI